MTRLDGAVPHEGGTSQEIALAALTRRVAELEHRLAMMKIIIGLVLAAKVLFVVLFIYILFGNVFAGRVRPMGQPILLQKSLLPAEGQHAGDAAHRLSGQGT